MQDLPYLQCSCRERACHVPALLCGCSARAWLCCNRLKEALLDACVWEVHNGEASPWQALSASRSPHELSSRTVMQRALPAAVNLVTVATARFRLTCIVHEPSNMWYLLWLLPQVRVQTC